MIRTGQQACASKSMCKKDSLYEMRDKRSEDLIYFQVWMAATLLLIQYSFSIQPLLPDFVLS